MINIMIPKAFELFDTTPTAEDLKKAYMSAATGIVVSIDPYKQYFSVRDYSSEFQEIERDITKIISSLTEFNIIEVLDSL
jgi:hypothetical protein